MNFIETVKKCKYLQWLKKTPAYIAYTKRVKADKINKMIDEFVGEEISKRELSKLQWEMSEAYAKYQWNFDEFFLFHYWLLSKAGKETFATEARKNSFCDLVNEPEVHKLFKDKFKTYQIFSSFYKREIIPLRKGDDGLNSFKKFAKKHSQFVIKPNDLALGQGVKIVNSFEGSLEELYVELASEYTEGAILEEVIQQNELTATFHPGSVNTLRINTFRFKNEIQILPCFFRIGRGESVVDNAGAGGIIASVDVDSGILLSAGDELGGKYVYHPESGVQIVGFKLPEWEKAKELAKQLAMIVPSSRYIGWDLAYTNYGWIMIEGNSKAQFVWQIPSQEGFNPELIKIEKRFKEESGD